MAMAVTIYPRFANLHKTAAFHRSLMWDWCIHRAWWISSLMASPHVANETDHSPAPTNLKQTAAYSLA